MRKNISGQKIGAGMVAAADGSEFTGSVTVYVTGDAGTQAVGSVGSGACTHEGHGYHTYAPSQAETNYNLIAFTFTGSGAVPATIQIETRVDLTSTEIAAIHNGDPQALATSVATGSTTTVLVIDDADDLLAGGLVGYECLISPDGLYKQHAYVTSVGALISDQRSVTIFPALSGAPPNGTGVRFYLPKGARASDNWSYATRILTASTNISIPSAATVAAAVRTELAAELLIVTHVGTGIELDGSVYRWTTNALEQAPSVGSGDAWEELTADHLTPDTFGYMLQNYTITLSDEDIDAIGDGIAAGDSFTVSPYLVDDDHTWTFKGNETTSRKLIPGARTEDVLYAMDFTNVMPDLDSIQSVTSATFANISGTEPTVGTIAPSADRKKATIMVDSTLATAGTYTLTVTIVTADGQTFVRSGRTAIS